MAVDGSPQNWTKWIAFEFRCSDARLVCMHTGQWKVYGAGEYYGSLCIVGSRRSCLLNHRSTDNSIYLNCVTVAPENDAFPSGICEKIAIFKCQLTRRVWNARNAWVMAMIWSRRWIYIGDPSCDNDLIRIDNDVHWSNHSIQLRAQQRKDARLSGGLCPHPVLFFLLLLLLFNHQF